MKDSEPGEALLSFVIPSFNSCDVVAEAIDSAFEQELGVPFEVVVVDDGSTDETAALLGAKRRAVGELLTVVSLRENQGGGAARNRGIERSSGEFIYMLDADNVLPKGCVAPQLGLALAEDAAAVSVASVQFFSGDDGSHLHRWLMEERNGSSGIEELFTSVRVPASHGNYVFRRSTYERAGGYEERRGAMDAWTFGFKHVALGLPTLIAPQTAYLHRVDRPGHASYWTREQLSGTNDRNALETVLSHVDLLPAAIGERVRRLGPDAKLLELIEDGAFRPEADFDEVLNAQQSNPRRFSLRRALSGLRR